MRAASAATADASLTPASSQVPADLAAASLICFRSASRPVSLASAERWNPWIAAHASVARRPAPAR